MPRSTGTGRTGAPFLLPLAVALVLAMGGPGAAAAATPSGFADALVATVPAPTALAFTPDGRLLIASRTGQIRIVKGGTLLSAVALDLAPRLCSNSERGLLGIAVDPGFDTNRAIYAFYTYRRAGSCSQLTPSTDPVNRISRFTVSGDTVDPASEVVLVDNILTSAGGHNAGDLNFGKDGYLYATVGDGICDYAAPANCGAVNDASRDRHVLAGKVLRITRDGGVPPTNPFLGADSARCNVTGRTDVGKICQETFAWGLRNPFRFAFDPNATGTRFFVNDVGQDHWDEIDEGRAGADYGWNVREGFCARGSATDCGAPPVGMTNPVYSYGVGVERASITGGAFVPNGAWPAGFDGDYLYADYVRGTISRLSRDSGGAYRSEAFVTGLGEGSAIHLRFGPHGTSQALYYTTYAVGGQVRRLAPTANRPPTAVLTTEGATGGVPRDVGFDASGSSDPDTGDTLTYRWTWGDGTPAVETSAATTRHTYTSFGTYSATLVVRDSRGGVSDPVSVVVHAGNTPPAVSIDAPTTATRFRVGETLTLQASATDAQDGALPATALRWEVLRRHDNHTHPYLDETGNGLSLTAPAPEDLPAAATSDLLIRVTATDAHGATTRVEQRVLPATVDVTFATQPAGLRVDVNGTTLTGPQTVTSWVGYVLNVRADAQTTSTGQGYAFASWSDGGAAAHAVTTPAAAATYTATFVASNVGTGLSGEYFDRSDFLNPVAVRTEAVNFDWRTGAPITGMGVDTFSVRWTGEIVPRYSQTYTFTTYSDDGVRLWVDGRQIISNYTVHSLTADSGTITLVAGRRYSIRLDYFESSQAAAVRLAWSSPSQARETVPASRLYPARTTGGTGLKGQYYDNRDLTNLKLTRVDPT
jgi:glucose/arabinose dehydrogenase/PKD repeat protein